MSISIFLTENNSYLCSNDLKTKPEAKLRKVSSAMDLSTLSLNFSAISLSDSPVNLVSKIWTNFSNPSPEVIAGNGLKSRAAVNEKSKKSIPIISLDEVSWHDTVDDCWLVICDYVYDCTEFINNHPGGQDVLLEYAGRDATLAFIGSGHSKAANTILEKFLIGELPVSERIFRTQDGIKVGDCI